MMDTFKCDEHKISKIMKEDFDIQAMKEIQNRLLENHGADDYFISSHSFNSLLDKIVKDTVSFEADKNELIGEAIEALHIPESKAYTVDYINNEIIFE